MAKNLEQPLVEHLIELRKRVIISLISLLVVFLILYPFRDLLYIYFSDPLRALLPDNSQMVAIDVTSTFMTPFKLTFFVALCLAIPIILLQIWKFVAPALYTDEKKYGFIVLVLSIGLFYTGLFFCYFVALPLLFGFFTSTGPTEIALFPDMKIYLNLVLGLMVIFGLVFQVPIVILLGLKSGVLQIQQLTQARRYIIVGAFVIGMLLTPADIFSQSLVAIPMWLLFELSLLFWKWLNLGK